MKQYKLKCTLFKAPHYINLKRGNTKEKLSRYLLDLSIDSLANGILLAMESMIEL